MAGLDDFLNLLGDRNARGELVPSASLEELQQDIDPETGAYNSVHLDTISGKPIDPNMFAYPVGGPLDAIDQPAGPITEVGRPRPTTGMYFDDDDAAAYEANVPRFGTPAPVASVQRSEPIAPPTLPDPGFAPNTGSVQVGVSPNQRNYGAATLREDQIQGPGRGAEQDATMQDPFSIEAVLMGMLRDATGGVLGEESANQARFREDSPLSGVSDVAASVAPVAVGGGPLAAGLKRAIPGGTNKLLEWFRMLQGLKSRGAGGPAQIGQTRRLAPPSAANRPPGYTPPGSGRPISKPSPGNPPGRRRASGTVPVLQ